MRIVTLVALIGPPESIEIAVMLPRQFLDWMHLTATVLESVKKSITLHPSKCYGRRVRSKLVCSLAKGTHKTCICYRHPVRRLCASVLTVIPFFSAVIAAMISGRQKILIKSSLEELHSTLQSKGLTVENWLSYLAFSSWPALREVTVFLFVSTYLISTLNLWRRGTASCEHMASSSKQESKLPGRMGLCRLNSHLSGSLLVFRRKMSPV